MSNFAGQSDCLTMDTIESIIIVEQGFETIKQVDNIEVEETCVLVNRDEHFVPSKEGKHRLYKVLALPLSLSLPFVISPFFNFLRMFLFRKRFRMLFLQG